MPTKDKRVDAYIAKSADFAKPILNHLRALVHQACPQVEETIKWNFPHFTHRGSICYMAAFKAHCSFGFWKSALVLGPDRGGREKESAGNFGRITALADLPSDQVLSEYIKKAAALNEAGIKVPDTLRRNTKKELVVPDYFMAALRENKKALATFENYSYSHKKEYVQWVGEAKREETRVKRLAQAVEWLAQGKSRNWRYEKC
jgi:uncharacterized protein YdeI (YjbR/CyaY-like superfamily)